MEPLSDFGGEWRAALKERSAEQADDLPNYHVSDPESLVCTSHPESFEIGTGASIYTRTLLPAILEAEHEVILVTCFWARSSTLSALNETLTKLAEHRRGEIRNESAGGPDARILPPLRIRICFSSRSPFQKLFHTSSRAGYVYPPSQWPTKLGLPAPELLGAGRIDLRVKTLFFLPFSVMHPKFLIVDRRRAFLPSSVINALLEALQRGINVTIVTSKGMMVLEQIITAGTTTSMCLVSFIRRYRQRKARISKAETGGEPGSTVDLEAQYSRLGKLKISYFRPTTRDSATRPLEEPVQSHLKLTIVDGQYTVLGSGNMDRASWFTSQELGILFQSREFASSVSESVADVLSDRVDTIFDSEAR
ncbi:hypothetical protein DL762_005710 [Monosporascus cannonballus]|uniref:PLD phosphodiesterase domain-containing protein n=1 Tax=Monosporascus cannonballus TaxID=155416 RepID=A0ABY0H7F3_9PEZI|nr:hypothetical protein DL762_005710 [Monosporascus cannonballus]